MFLKKQKVFLVVTSAMGLSKINLRKRVHKKVSRRTIVYIWKFVKKRELLLWGQNKWKYFLLDSIYFNLYKDLLNNGSIKLKEKVKQWYKHTTKNIYHNYQEIRREMSFGQRPKSSLKTKKFGLEQEITPVLLKSSSPTTFGWIMWILV